SSRFFLSSSLPHPHLHSFPTRRSSDLSMLRRSSVFLLLVPMWLWAQAAPKASFVIKAARLIDVRSGNVLSNQQILVEDGVIKERSEEHTSELQSLAYLVCRLLLEKKKN